MRRVDPAAMPATDRTVDTVASLLLTIHRDESGVFYTSIETMPPGPRMAQPAILPAYASERDVETETFATAGPESARAPRWRRCLIAAAAVAVLVGCAVALHSPSGSSDSLSSPGSTVPTASSKAFPPSSADCADVGGSACSDATGILPGLGTACTDLLTTAAHAVDEDPQQWTQSVLVSMVRSGKPLADVIRQWLTGTRADVLATRYADLHLETILRGIDSAIAEVDTNACSPHTAIAVGPVDAACGRTPTPDLPARWRGAGRARPTHRTGAPVTPASWSHRGHKIPISGRYGGGTRSDSPQKTRSAGSRYSSGRTVSDQHGLRRVRFPPAPPHISAGRGHFVGVDNPTLLPFFYRLDFGVVRACCPRLPIPPRSVGSDRRETAAASAALCSGGKRVVSGRTPLSTFVVAYLDLDHIRSRSVVRSWAWPTEPTICRTAPASCC